MASPPYPASPLATSPPHPSPAPLPSKKRNSTALDPNLPAVKRRKPSSMSQSSVQIHPLRQTSFPPEGRSPSAEAASIVSGSVVSAGGAGRKKKRGGRKSKAGVVGEEAGEAVAGGKEVVGGRDVLGLVAGDKEGEDEEEEKEEEMALEDAGTRTQEQKQEEIRVRALLVESLDTEQYNRYEQWRAAKLSDAVVKRVVNATVSQSVPQMVSTAVKAVTKLFAGEIIEGARAVQEEWIAGGEAQSDLPTPTPVNEGGEARRGPLRPDHLREAYRRYKISGESHGVGMQHLWHAQQGDGVERFSTRTGRRMFM